MQLCFPAKSWISLKSVYVCYVLLFSLLILFMNGCVNLQTALLTPETYHFRKVRWGSTKASVLLAERGKRVHFESGNALVFRHRHRDVPGTQRRRPVFVHLRETLVLRRNYVWALQRNTEKRLISCERKNSEVTNLCQIE